MTHGDLDEDLIEDPLAGGTWHDPRCRDGWLPETVDRRPVPCLACRPHIGQEQDRRRRHRPRQLASDDAREDAMRTIRAALAQARMQHAAPVDRRPSQEASR